MVLLMVRRDSQNHIIVNGGGSTYDAYETVLCVVGHAIWLCLWQQKNEQRF